MPKNPTAIADEPVTTPITAVAGLRVLGRRTPIVLDEVWKRASQPGSIIVGRSSRCDIRIDDDTVSSRHCAIYRNDQGLWEVHDCHSTNGLLTSYYGDYSPYDRVESRTLKLGLHIRLGVAVLVAVDAQGDCPLFVRTETELIRRKVELYGSIRAAGKHCRISARTIARRIRRKEGNP